MRKTWTMLAVLVVFVLSMPALSLAAAGVAQEEEPPEDLTRLAEPEGSMPPRLELAATETLFAVVTHKAGLFASKAHNHLVVAPAPNVELRVHPGVPESITLRFSTASADLVIDDFALQERWYPRLAELAILDEPFSALEPKQQAKVRGAMLSAKQLDAGRFPEIRAELIGLEPAASSVGDVEMGWSATVAVEVHGQRVERQVATRLEASPAGRLEVEVVGEFLFSEFGIEPYSAMLGAVKNEDLFHLYVHFVAAPE